MPTYTCGSSGCPCDLLEAQGALTAALMPSLTGAKSNVFFVTLVPRRAAPRVTNLAAFEVSNLHRRVKEDLRPIRIEWAIMVLDMTLNEHEANRLHARWQHHYHGFIVTSLTRKELRLALKRVFPKSEAIPRPVHVKEWNGSEGAIRYLLKPDIYRRISSDHGERFDRKTGRVRLCKTTRSDRLRAAEQIELALYLDKIGLQSRLLCLRCRMRNGMSLAILNGGQT